VRDLHGSPPSLYRPELSSRAGFVHCYFETVAGRSSIAHADATMAARTCERQFKLIEWLGPRPQSDSRYGSYGPPKKTRSANSCSRKGVQPERPVDWIADSQEDSQLHVRRRTNVNDPGT
jgi:hypothetical protein